MITRDDLQLRILSCMSMEGSGIVKYRDDVNKISAVTSPQEKTSYHTASQKRHTTSITWKRNLQTSMNS